MAGDIEFNGLIGEHFRLWPDPVVCGPSEDRPLSDPKAETDG